MTIMQIAFTGDKGWLTKLVRQRVMIRMNEKPALRTVFLVPESMPGVVEQNFFIANYCRLGKSWRRRRRRQTCHILKREKIRNLLETESDLNVLVAVIFLLARPISILSSDSVTRC